MSGPGSIPKSTQEAIKGSSALLKPVEIKVQKNGKFTEIVGFKFLRDMPETGERFFVQSRTGT